MNFNLILLINKMFNFFFNFTQGSSVNQGIQISDEIESVSEMSIDDESLSSESEYIPSEQNSIDTEILEYSENEVQFESDNESGYTDMPDLESISENDIPIRRIVPYNLNYYNHYLVPYNSSVENNSDSEMVEYSNNENNSENEYSIKDGENLISGELGLSETSEPYALDYKLENVYNYLLDNIDENRNKCRGCRDNILNQLGHMEPGGCLYNDTDDLDDLDDLEDIDLKLNN